MRSGANEPLKFPIRIDLIWQPFLLFVGATPANSYVEIDGGELRIRFGPTFHASISRENVVGAVPGRWSIFDGFGVQAGGQIVGLIGSTAGVVELQLRHPARLRYVGWPWVVDRIAISLEDPGAFMQAVAAREPGVADARRVDDGIDAG